jgi:hypothetical protein
MSVKLLSWSHFQEIGEANEGTNMCHLGRSDILLPHKSGYGESVTAMPQAHAVE